MTDDRVLQILREAKSLAREYRQLTGKPLGITGEVAEYEAWRILGVELSPARNTGYDAIERMDGVDRRLQIKGRCLLSDRPGQRIGRIDIEKDWDGVLLVLLDPDFEATAIYEADRADVVAALTAPGSKARNERGALAVSKFRAIGRERWRADRPQRVRSPSREGGGHGPGELQPRDPAITRVPEPDVSRDPGAIGDEPEAN